MTCKSVKYVKNLENNGKKHATVYDVLFFYSTIGLDNYPKTGRNVVKIFYCYFLPLHV